MAKLDIIHETNTEGLGRKALIRTPAGNYELRCMWQGGASFYMTAEEVASFGAAMVVEAGVRRFLDD